MHESVCQTKLQYRLREQLRIEETCRTEMMRKQALWASLRSPMRLEAIVRRSGLSLNALKPAEKITPSVTGTMETALGVSPAGNRR